MKDVMKFVAIVALASVSPVWASDVDGELWWGAVPVLDGTEGLIAMGEIPGGTRSNLDSANRWTSWPNDLPESSKLILADAQTSGGLLAAVDPAKIDRLLDDLGEKGERGFVVGEVGGVGAGNIKVKKSESDERPK